MQLNKKQGLFLTETISKWQNDQIISNEEANKLLGSYSIRRFDWGKLAKYSFWTSIICFLIAVSAMIADQWFIRILEYIFVSSSIAACLVFSGFASLSLAFAFKRRQKYPDKSMSNETIIFIGVLFIALAVAYLGKAIDTGSGHYSLLFLLATAIYAVLAICFPSKLVWIFSLLSLGAWFGGETGYQSGAGAYYLGMNYPLRFVFFGIALVGLSYAFARYAHGSSRLAPFTHSTKIMAFLYLFISLWILSIFGNYGDISAWWHKAEQFELFGWGILFAIAAIIAIVYGLKFDDAAARGFGITFLFINLYTKYFEYFWNHTHKAIFFIVLAISFWLIGRYAEKIWNLEFIQSNKTLENQKAKMH